MTRLWSVLNFPFTIALESGLMNLIELEYLQYAFCRSPDLEERAPPEGKTQCLLWKIFPLRTSGDVLCSQNGLISC